jgi:hypothetical protein
MISDMIKATGQLQIIVLDENGQVKQELNVPNMIVNLGKNFIVSRMNLNPPTAMSHMAIGGNDTVTVPTMTTLVTEALSAGATGTKIRAAVTTTVSNNSITYSATFPSGSPTTAFTVKEAGIFNSATTGTMLARTTFGAVQKNTNDSIVINWTITIN